MRIGDLAQRTGTTTRALRYYESRGLLTAGRDGNGYRDYGEDDLRVLRQIQVLQGLGFELEDTRPFVECLQAGHPTGDACPASLDAYRRKLAELDRCIADLQHVRDSLQRQLGRAEAESGTTAIPAPLCELSSLGGPAASVPTQQES
ncbi:MerR family transcriptional regulator [Streptomyces gilvosporeus]|uniref:MerR family transcriptional regulator n=1 Tax=Streptomyces gilvosporeus TaxID=553510 RepID=A0A1V0TYP0_9ACTN|nr:MerR family transcriptional regulator [Streptomyces gilvosporeus]ARF57910.1 MerR family transcriptional regulator [Streptomyces gilvosporeus]